MSFVTSEHTQALPFAASGNALSTSGVSTAFKHQHGSKGFASGLGDLHCRMISSTTQVANTRINDLHLQYTQFSCLKGKPIL